MNESPASIAASSSSTAEQASAHRVDPEIMPSRLRNLRTAAVSVFAACVLLAGVIACDEETEETVAEPQVVDRSVDDDEPEEDPDAAAGPASSAADVRLATEVLMQLVAAEDIDSRHFSVNVISGDVEIVPTADATADESERAVALARAVGGVRSARLVGEPVPTPANNGTQAANSDEIVLDGGAGNAGHEADPPTADAGAAEAEVADVADTFAAEVQVGTPAEIEEPPVPTADNEAGDGNEGNEAGAANNGGGERIYTVVAGDSLSGIAARELGDGNRWTDIYELNRDSMSSPERIRLGMQLRLPAP